ncbi:MAG: PLP-dependent aminotransferase family protein [Christensenellales bacterium]
MLELSLDPHDSRPLYEQIYQHIVADIKAGRLPPDSALPSRRALRDHLKISAATVESAYGLLQAEGYIRALPRRGFFVNPLVLLPQGRPLPAPTVPAPRPEPPRFDFSTSACDAALFPYRVWAKLFKETLYSRPDLLQRGEPEGDSELRLMLSGFLYQYRGLRAEPEHILIGAGADYLLGVLLQLLPPGAVIAAEDPGYQGIYRAAARQGISCLPIPCDAQGISARKLQESAATVCYVTPSHQFPLGISMPIGRRTQLLHWASQGPGRLLIEDDYDSEFRHSARPLPAMQGLGQAERVVYIGTFSRSLAPSMRLAYMVLPPSLLAACRGAHLKTGETVSRFEQQTLARFIGDGHYLRHLRRAGRAYAQRLQRLQQALQALPLASVSGQQAGLHFLLRVPGLSEETLLKRAAGAGIHLKGLSEYCRAVKPPPSTLVLGYAGLQDALIGEAVAALANAWGMKVK